MNIRKSIYPTVGDFFHCYNRITWKLQKRNNEVIVFDTSIKTHNLGDFIIMYYCNQILEELFPKHEKEHISTHDIPSLKEEMEVKEARFKIVCGTNLLTSHIEEWWNWRLPEGLLNKLPYRNAILLGLGWGNYQDSCSRYTKMIYKSILNPTLMHSVRDIYTENKLKEAGIKNVIYTGCPTMWRLTPEFCHTIPKDKSLDVITTITDYRQDIERDNEMLAILSRNYRKVYLWLQGKQDEKYLAQLHSPENLEIIPGTLQDYEAILMKGNIDYVGTRLHAGIFALNHKVRTFVVAVDNRAIEISKDTGLPIIVRENGFEQLERRIRNSLETKITIPLENIQRFKSQFKEKK